MNWDANYKASLSRKKIMSVANRTIFIQFFVLNLKKKIFSSQLKWDFYGPGLLKYVKFWVHSNFIAFGCWTGKEFRNNTNFGNIFERHNSKELIVTLGLKLCRNRVNLTFFLRFRLICNVQLIEKWILLMNNLFYDDRWLLTGLVCISSLMPLIPPI